jgi:hypothetical protein
MGQPEALIGLCPGLDISELDAKFASFGRSQPGDPDHAGAVGTTMLPSSVTAR